MPRRATAEEASAHEVRTDDRPVVSAESLRERLVERALAAQRAQAADEVDRLVEATYRVMAAQGTVEPRVRDILKEADLSTQTFYRHFASKDELLLVILDDGRRLLAGYLAHRMEKVRAKGPEAEVRAWIEGMLAQAADPAASTRTRPFIAEVRRLGDLHPEEQQRSMRVMADLLTAAVGRGVEDGVFEADDVEVVSTYVYRLVVGVMEEHVLEASAPEKVEVDHLVAFCLKALAPSARS
jgi:AcrR family transcriptional regulator